jgi:nucleoside-diphosphate-sugar epimerase
MVVLGDIHTSTTLAAALRGVDVVVHLAARVHMMNDDAPDTLTEFRRVNVEGTVALARAAVEHGVRRIVFVSSVKVNGEATAGRPFTDDDAPAPQDPYGVSKREAEDALRMIGTRTGMEITIVRPALVYGPGVRANFLHLLKTVERGIPLPLPNIQNRRSLVGVENLADLLVECVGHPGAANETFMASDGEDVSTRELVARMAKALGRPARFLPVPESAIRLAARMTGKEAAVDRLFGSLVVDSSKARQKLGWKPPVTLDNGLAATARWYLETKASP